MSNLAFSFMSRFVMKRPLIRLRQKASEIELTMEAIQKLVGVKESSPKSEDKEQEIAVSIEAAEVTALSDSENEEGRISGLFAALSSYVFAAAAAPRRKGSFIEGLDYWVPLNCEEIIFFPTDMLLKYTQVYPLRPKQPGFSNFAVFTDAETLDRQKPAMHHLVLTLDSDDPTSKSFSLSLFRDREISDVAALCERCRECSSLFRYFPRENTTEWMASLLHTIKSHLLWQQQHIAAFNDISEFFERITKKWPNILNTLSRPEGWSPLMIAVQQGNEKLVVKLLELGADITQTDFQMNNVLHFAANITPSMITLLWESSPEVQPLLNKPNSDGATPQYIAWKSVNARCATTLMSLSHSANPEDFFTNPLFEMVKAKNVSKSAVEAVLESNPDSYKEKDPSTESTLLHVALYKTPILHLLDILGDKLDVNARDACGRTPLHVYAFRNDLPLIFAISVYNCDLNAQDNDGNTPLHIAVANLHTEVVRALLCLGSNPNVKNKHEETARHLIAKACKNHKEAVDIARSLIMMGASDCPVNKLGCTMGCAHPDNNLRSKSSGKLNAVQKESLDESKSELTSKSAPAVSSAVDSSPDVNSVQTASYEFELDPDTLDVDKAYSEPNPSRSFPQMVALKRIHDELKEVKDPSKSNIISTIAFDGGGLKGIVMTQTLIALQRYLKHPVREYFDWMGATSTGGVISSNFVLGQDMRTIQKQYLKTKDVVFHTWSRPYKIELLQRMIDECVGENVMGQFPYPRMFTTTVRADIIPSQLELIRNYRLPLSNEENDELGFEDPMKVKMSTAMRRTSAAPTYFPASEKKYLDGGCLSNNPTLDLLSEISFWNSTCEMKNATSVDSQTAAHEVRLGCVVSIGCGITPTAPVDPTVLDMAGTLGILKGIKTLGNMVIDQLTNTEGPPVTRARSWCHSMGVPFFRLNVPLFKEIMLDVSDDSDIGRMMWECEVYAYTHRKDFEELANLLESIGSHHSRKHLFSKQQPLSDLT